MKLVPVFCLAAVLTACRSEKRSDIHLYIWNEKQLIAEIDQDPERQDTWTAKEIHSNTFLIFDLEGNYIKRK